MDKNTFNDLLAFQQREIVYTIVSNVMSGETYTFTPKRKDNAMVANCGVVICMNECGDIPHTLSSEITPIVANALKTFNRAPDNHQLIDFLASLRSAA